MTFRSLRLPQLFFSAIPLLLAALPQASAQDSYPSRLIRIIVPTSPGAGLDVTARLIAQGLSDRLGWRVVVENRAGASTMIGNDMVAKAPPDGYTLLMGVSSLAINPAMYKKVPYDALRDFAPITLAVLVPNLVAVHRSVPVKSVKELIALAKARPGEILYGSPGSGTNPHLTMELFASMAKVRMVHVPYKGATPSVIDVIAGNIATIGITFAMLIPHVRDGKLRALGVTSASRIAVAPDIPTVAEAGPMPGYESVNWFGLLAPARTPEAIMARLHKEVVAILRSPEIKQRFHNDAVQGVAGSPEEFSTFIKTETVKWAKVARDAGIQPE
ncbi:MAG: tripartite tricarboxylate transporter substrate binding protein [Betaproteobacteria bacterium]|nr:tripartite tricarboxylate transporter substrate binding protein [Betaproteobacteria bacterium]